jgi:L-asparaginase II
MTANPELIGGERRDATRLMRAVPELMAKGGAEGMYAAAIPGGPAVAVKISDGAHRASGIVLAAALREAGVDVDPAQLGEPIRGHGKPVGACRPLIGTAG